MNWMKRAACKGKSDIFYPHTGDDHHAARAEAEATCARCPVLAQCEEARQLEEQTPADMHGFRAGRSADDRKQEWRDERGQGRRVTPGRRRRMEEAWRLHQAGADVYEIARQLGCTDRTVHRFLAHVRADLAPTG